MVAHVRPHDESETECVERSNEGQKEVLGAEKFENLDDAPPSVRAAVLGKGGSSGSDSSMGAGREPEQEQRAEEERIDEEGGVSFDQEHSEERCIPVRIPVVKPSAK